MKRGRNVLAAATILAALIALPGAPEPALARVPASVFVPNDRTRAADSLATHQRLMLHISQFNLAWQMAWRDSEAERGSVEGWRVMADRREKLVHCHPDGTLESLKLWQPGQAEFSQQVLVEHEMLESKASYFSACPSWLLTYEVFMAEDETVYRDGGLLDSLRPRIRKLRGKLIAQFDSASRQWPNDGWIAGQRVRLLIDQRNIDRAILASRECNGRPSWCAAMQGFAYASKPDMLRADSAFGVMRQLMTPAERCAWEDARDVIEKDERKSYTSQSCDKRELTNQRLWWLSDPLLRTPGNERLVEQEVRRVEIALRRSMTQDERFTWDDEYGGDALTKLLLRYGWPSYTGWLRDSVDVGHTSYLASMKSPRASPYTSFEYTLDRIHVVPTWATLASPFAATDSSWDLSHDDEAGNISPDWWPGEHYRPARRLLQLNDGQSAAFRRQSQILFAAAIDLTHFALMPEAGFASATIVSKAQLAIPEGLVRQSRYDVLLLSSQSPSRIDSLAQTVSLVGSTVALQGLIPPVPTLIGIEAAGIGSATVDARSRFGLIPPMPLDSMKRGEIATSDPVLLSVSNDAAAPMTASDGVLDRMLGSTRLGANSRRIGIYWETYGVQPTDTVTVAVSVEGDNDLSPLRRFAIAMNVTADPNRAIIQSWREPSSEHSTRIMQGTVPVQMRELTLNLSALRPGPYTLRVILTKGNAKSVVGTRHLTLTK